MSRSRAAALAIVRRFEAAHERHLFSGAGDPDDCDWLEREYREARERLVRHLSPPPDPRLDGLS